jgi:hypothetical protein
MRRSLYRAETLDVLGRRLKARRSRHAECES